MKERILLILDLDGVLITTPAWKPDDLHKDGYSKFNKVCIDNFNQILKAGSFDIWLCSTRRLGKQIEEFNQIFKARKINQSITGFLPENVHCKNRKEEIETFLKVHKPKQYLIIDDDKSLNGLPESIKTHLILTSFLKGITIDNVNQALDILDI